MALSLKSLLKGGKTSVDDDNSDDLASLSTFDSGGEELLETPSSGEKKKSKKKKKKKLGLQSLANVPVLSKLPLVQNSLKPKEPEADPFDNPALLARIASEVASLPMPEVVAEEDEHEEEAVDTPMFDTSVTEGMGSRATRKQDNVEEKEYSFEMPTKEELGYSRGEDFEAMEDDPSLDGDEGMGGTSAGKGKKVAVAAVAVVALAAAGGGAWWWMNHSASGTGKKEAASEGRKKAAPSNQPQSGVTISMALPPPPSESPVGQDPAMSESESQGERSASRRPWLAGGAEGGVSGSVAGSMGGSAPAEAGGGHGGTMESPVATGNIAFRESNGKKSGVSGEIVGSGEHGGAAEGMGGDHGEGAGGAHGGAAAGQDTGHGGHGTVGAAGAKQPLRRSFAPLPVLTDIKTPTASAGDPPSFEKLVKLPAPPHGLAEAPVNDLLRRTSFGLLPVKGPNGQTAWQTYSRPYTAPEKNPRLAIIVVGLGLNPAATQAAIETLPPDVSLSFSPYAANLASQMAAARARGHEVLLDLPMEPKNFPEVDPGPLALMSGVSAADNVTRLETVLSKGVGYVGVVARFGGKFDEVGSDVRPVMENLQDRGLMMVGPLASAGISANAEMPLPIADSLLMIDERPFREAIDARLSYAAAAAKARGVSVVLAQPFPITLQRISSWLATSDGKSVTLAPATSTASVGG